ncbi:hypothetical protein [Flagellimonas sp. W118]|uniref:hypothetical protein n=1 Tax=Flagellimonas sp. W118 TaxID=3410791 RepID=UPI003BF60A97
MKKYLALSLAFLLSVSCSKDEEQAYDSLIGSWTISEIKSIYPESPANGISSNEVVEETGILGTFVFNKRTVNFDFVRNDTVYQGNATWNLDLEKVRSGFTRENSFTLDVDGFFLFDAFFGDGTRNSEKNAESLFLIQTVDNDFTPIFEMTLKK